MGIFSKPEIIILKESNSAEEHLAKLEELLPRATGKVKENIQKEIILTKAGIDGEKKVLYELKNKNYQYDYIVVDQFEPPKSYYNHISDTNCKVTDITFLTKAEDQCLSVACSSLISRYIFLNEMNKLSKSVNILLPKGANPKVDEVAKKIVETFGQEKLNDIAKLNFKNTERIIN